MLRSAGMTAMLTLAVASPLHASLLSTFELDGNVTTLVLGTSGSTTPSHDYQVFADNNTIPPSTSGAGPRGLRG